MVTPLPDRWRRPIGLALAALAVLAIGTAFWVSIDGAPRVAADAYTYLAAGERLNAGHNLYELAPGDRSIWINPPFWTVPLLSPPLIGVLWRPLAALPAEAGIVVWQVGTIGIIAATTLALVARLPILASSLAIVLALSIGFEMDVANVNGILLGGFVLAWWLFARHKAAVGPVIAIMAAVKLAPVILAWWLVTQSRWRAVAWGALAAVAALIIGVAGSSLDMHREYLVIATQTVAAGNSDLSLAGLGLRVGMDPAVAAWLPRLAVVAGAAAVWVVRSRPGLAFGIAVAVAVLGSPVVNFNSLAMLMAMLAPLAWPVQATSAAEQGGVRRSTRPGAVVASIGAHPGWAR